MIKRYIVGVDGGNTKTDYFLYDTDGSFISKLRAGTCSHERMPDSYEGSYREMKKEIENLLKPQGLTVEDVEVAVLGLAGLDMPSQKQNLEKVMERIGFKNFIVDNDGYLGLKAGGRKGIGICSVNGTGTVTVGIDKEGNRAQIGGIGYISGDDGGGAFIARELFREVYTTLYRGGKETKLIEPVFQLLHIEEKIYYTEALAALYRSGFSHTPYISLIFDYAEQGDEVALKIIHKVGRALAKSTAGCIHELSFEKEETVEVILVGSVWVKVKSTLLIDAYKTYMKELTTYSCNYTVLQVPPAVGAVLWALEIVKGKVVEEPLRSCIMAHTTVFDIN